MFKNILKVVAYSLAMAVILPVTSIFGEKGEKTTTIKDPVLPIGPNTAHADFVWDDTGDDGGGDCDEGGGGDEGC